MPTASKRKKSPTARARNLQRSIALGELVDETMRLFQVLRQAEENMHADGLLGESERGVLFALFTDGPQSVPALARTRGRTRQRMLQVADRLAELDYVQRHRNPNSDKSPLHGLTARGRKKVMSMLRKERRLYENMTESLSLRRLQNARSVLQELRTEILAHD
ncbi:MAG: MarR family winged helix-turn-helix transcriptional regulator [bacterium]|nr:MarR family winged helix-turn-helix transcriptional regulator [bacterium]